MLKKRLIPVLLLKNGRMVKTIKFEQARDVGFPVTAAKIYDAQCVDEIIFLDILASVQGRQSLIETIDNVTKECFMPFTAGGGVRSLLDIKTLLKAGADKVSINTAAVSDPILINRAAKQFGSANIVVSIDYKKTPSGKKVFTHGGQNESRWEVIDWAKEAERLGAGEILLNSIDHDGTMLGYDIEIIREASDLLKIPVIACGGAGKLNDFLAVINDGHASAMAAGSIFNFTDQSPIKARAYLKEYNINVRFAL